MRSQSRKELSLWKELSPWRLQVPLRLVQMLSVYPCTWGYGKTQQPESSTSCWSVGPLCFPSSSKARLTLLFKIIGLFFKQQPGWSRTGWGCGRPKFNAALTLRGRIKHFPMLQKTLQNYENSSRCGLLCYVSAVETAVTQVWAHVKFLCKSLWLQFLGILVAINKISVLK